MTDARAYRSTMGLCLGLRGGLSSAIVVLTCRRDDPARRLYVTREWEQPKLDVDGIAAELKAARADHHAVLTVGYYGGRDDDHVFSVLSVRLGQHIEPAPSDQIAPTQLLVDDFRTGRIKVRAGGLVERDVKGAIWRAGVPDQTGLIAALRCAHWGAQQYRYRGVKPKLADQKDGARMRARIRRQERPF